MIDARALRVRAATIMVDYGVRGYVVRVARMKGKVWAHCDYKNRELVFSRRLLSCDWVFANQIVLHEVAHILAGQKAGHGKAWRETARAMGYRLGAVVPYDSPVEGEHRWVAVCETRAHSAIRFERGKDGTVCGPCLEAGSGEVLVTWEPL